MILLCSNFLTNRMLTKSVHSQVISMYNKSLNFQLGPKSSQGRGGMGAKVKHTPHSIGIALF